MGIPPRHHNTACDELVASLRRILANQKPGPIIVRWADVELLLNELDARNDMIEQLAGLLPKAEARC